MPTKSDLTDERLLNLARKVVYSKFPKNLPNGLTHEDAVGEAFILAKAAKTRYDKESPPVDETLWVWVRTVNDLRDKFEVLRKQARGFQAKLPTMRVSPETADPFQVVARNEDLKAALQRLTADQRDVVEAVYLRGETQESVAKRRGVSQPAVSNMIRRAFVILRNTLGDDYLDN